MEALGRTAAIILAVILLILFPLRYDGAANDQSSYLYVRARMEHFLYEMSSKQQLTTQMYLKFCDELACTDTQYQITIERYQNYLYAPGGTEGINEVKSYFEYEDLLVLAASNGTVALAKGDYVTLRLEEKNKSYAKRLVQIFFPIYTSPESLITGGIIG